MPDLTSAAHTGIAGRWRFRLGLAIGILGVTALVSTIIAVTYDESLLTSLFLWLGLAALVLAFIQLPRSVTPGERPRMAASAAWIIVGIVLHVVVPVILNRS